VPHCPGAVGRRPRPGSGVRDRRVRRIEGPRTGSGGRAPDRATAHESAALRKRLALPAHASVAPARLVADSSCEPNAAGADRASGAAPVARSRLVADSSRTIEVRCRFKLRAARAHGRRRPTHASATLLERTALPARASVAPARLVADSSCEPKAAGADRASGPAPTARSKFVADSSRLVARPGGSLPLHTRLPRARRRVVAQERKRLVLTRSHRH